MVKRIELGTSYIVPKGLLGFYITPLFWIFETEHVKPFVYFDKSTFYKMCRKDWEWGKTVLMNIMQDLQSLIDEFETKAPTREVKIFYNYECDIIRTYKRRIREIRNILTERAVERPIYAYVKD